MTTSNATVKTMRVRIGRKVITLSVVGGFHMQLEPPAHNGTYIMETYIGGRYAYHWRDGKWYMDETCTRLSVFNNASDDDAHSWYGIANPFAAE